MTKFKSKPTSDILESKQEPLLKTDSDHPAEHAENSSSVQIPNSIMPQHPSDLTSSNMLLNSVQNLSLNMQESHELAPTTGDHEQYSNM